MHQFKFLFGSEIVAKASVFLVLPIAALFFPIEDLAKLSFFVNAIQALLPALCLGAIVLVPLSDFRNKDSMYTLFFTLALFLTFLNCTLFYLFSFDHAFILPASICSLLVYLGQFHLLGSDKTPTFLSLYFYRILLPLSIFILFLFDVEDHYSLFIGTYTFLTMVLLIVIVWRDCDIDSFKFDFAVLKKAIYKYQIYLPVIFNSTFAFFFLYYPKISSSGVDPSVILYISFAQYIQSFFLIFSTSFVRKNIREIYSCAEYDNFVLANYLTQNFHYIMMIIASLVFVLMAGAALVMDIGTFVPYALAYLVLVFFQMLYITSNDYLIAKGKGFAITGLMLCSVFCAYLGTYISSVTFAWLSVAIPLGCNALFFLSVYYLAFYRFGLLSIFKTTLVLICGSMIAITLGLFVEKFPLAYILIGMPIAASIIWYRKACLVEL